MFVPPVVAPLPTNLDTLPRRDLVALAEQRQMFVAKGDTAADIRTGLRNVEATARFHAQQVSNRRRRTIHAAAQAALVDTRLPSRALADAAGVFACLASPSGGGADDREVQLQLVVAQLVGVVRAAADPASGVTLEDALREAEEAAHVADMLRSAAQVQSEHTAHALRAVAQLLATDGR